MNTLTEKPNAATAGSAGAWSSRRQEEERVLKQIEDICSFQQPGARIPTQAELMTQLKARERAVMWALDELKRRGMIVRKRGSGTYVGQPNASAPSTAMSARAASKTIVVIARPDHGFYDDCISQLYSHADSRDFSIVYQLLRSQDEDAATFEPVLGSAAGFILFGYNLAPIARSLMAAGNQVVIIGAPTIDDVSSVPFVCNDHEAGGYLAVRHLIDLGHRRIGFQVNFEIELRSPRWAGYRRAIDDARRAGVAISETLIDFPKQDAWDAEPAVAQRDYQESDSPTAIVAWNDFAAARLIGVLQRAQIRVPDDVSVIGYDNASIADRLSPRLTTIDSGVGQLLGAAIRIIQMPDSMGRALTQMTIPHLVTRASTSAPRPSAFRPVERLQS